MSGLVFGDMGYELHIEGHVEPIQIACWTSVDGYRVFPFYLDENGHMERPSAYRIVPKDPARVAARYIEKNMGAKL